MTGKRKNFNCYRRQNRRKLNRFLDGGNIKMLGRYCRFNYGGGV